MAQLSVNDVTYVYVTKSSVNRQATTMLDPSSGTYIVEGEVLLATPTGSVAVQTATFDYAGTDALNFIFRNDKGIVKSPIIRKANVVDYKVVSYVAPTNKVIYVGYNGTSGSLECGNFIAGTDYMINVRKLGLLDTYGHMCNFHKTFGYYNATTTTSTGQGVVAKGIVKNGVANFSDKYGVDNFIKIEMVSSCADSPAAQTVSFIEGSKLAVGTTGHGIVAGDYIRTAAGTTNPVYYVESISGANQIYLETAYQGDSATITPRILTAGSIAAANFGIKLTGTTKTFNETDGKFRYDVPDFQITLKNFNDTDTTTSAYATLGNGFWKEVAQLERDALDYQGQTSFTDWQMPTRKTYATYCETYDLVLVRAYDDRKSTVAGTPKSYFTVIVPIAKTTDQLTATGSATVAAGIKTALDEWLS